MKIGILATAVFSDEQAESFGDLPSLFIKLLAPQDPDLTFETFNVCEDDFPTSPSACDGWVITGSPHSSYENLPWMRQLESFIRDTLVQKVPMIGICFGHQIMAQAMGGKVEPEASRRWGLAVHDYKIELEAKDRPVWLDGDLTTFSLQATHQDQVTELPAEAKRIGGSQFCPNGMLLYGQSGLSVQLHPELPEDFISTLIARRRGEAMTEVEADDALTRVSNPVDDQAFARWMVNFLKQPRA